MGQEKVPVPAEPEPISALMVPFALPPALARVRRRWDYAAQTGIGPHVSILFPFLPCAALGPRERTMARSVAARRSAPFAGRAQRMELWCQDGTGRWRTRWRMPFGVRP